MEKPTSKGYENSRKLEEIPEQTENVSILTAIGFGGAS